MEKYMTVFKKAQLFSGIDENDLMSMLGCLKASVKNVGKGGYIFTAGESISTIALLIDGCVHIQCNDYWGNLSILNVIHPGDIFGEAFAVPGSEPIINDVVSAKESTVLFMDINHVLTVCPSSCRFHNALISNLFSILAEKNRRLATKLRHMSHRTTREKLLSYLSEQESKAGSPKFDIPFNRQQLADFLSVDRSAMSSELSRMRDDGILEFKRNSFVLKQGKYEN